MKNFDVVTELETYKYNLPTSIEDIDKDYLLKLTNHIKVADHYSLIGLVYHEKLSSLIITYKQKRKDATAGVVPIFIKTPNADSKMFEEAEVRDKCIIASSDLALGHHVYVPNNVLSLNKFLANLEGDTNAYSRCMNDNFVAYFVEFKIIPNSAIHGIYKKEDEETNVLNMKYMTSVVSN